MTSKPLQSVPLNQAEAQLLQHIAAQNGTSVDEAATRLVQAGLAAMAAPKKRKKKAKVLGIRSRGKR